MVIVTKLVIVNLYQRHHPLVNKSQHIDKLLQQWKSSSMGPYKPKKTTHIQTSPS